MNFRETISEQELRRLYLDERMTQAEIAAKLGCSPTTVKRRMIELGIEIRPPQSGHLDFRRGNPEWNAKLGYAIGMIASDGNLSPDGRHFCIRSKDYELLETVKECLELEIRISTQRRLLGTYYSLSWSERAFYDWLETIGLMPAKSLVLGRIAVPDPYLPDFVRGVIDGDGSIRVYQDRWNTFKNPNYVYERVYVVIASASYPFLEWIQSQTARHIGVAGAIMARKRLAGRSQLWELKYAKKDSITLFKWIYYAPNVPALEQKRSIAMEALHGQNS